MPLAADPAATVRIVLDGDKDKTPTPCFLYRHLSYRQWAELSQFQEGLSAMTRQDTERAVERQMAFLRQGLVGWEHIDDPDTGAPMAFDPARIVDVVGLFEAQELLQRRLLAAMPAAADKKKLPSPSASDTAASVPAAGGSPDAAICPPPSCP